LKRLNQFNLPIFDAMHEISSSRNELVEFRQLASVGNVDWDINFHPFSAGGDSQLLLISAVPENELLADAIALKHKLLLAGIFSLLLMIPIALLLSRAISKPIRLLAKAADNIREFNLQEFRYIDSRIKEISILNIALDRLQKTIAAFTAYIPRDLVSDLLKSDDGIQVGGESRYLTILFSDLKDFSSLSEVTPSRELLNRVSSYLKLMTYAIKEEGGTVDKFIGDSVMAFWGAPTLDPHHAYHSAVAAMKTKRRMVKLNQALINEGKPPLVVRIGINTDAVLVGNIGSEERLSYTVMGDGVNIASRLEGMNKDFGTDIAISHSVFKEAGERLWVRPIDLITVKGRAGEILIYELLGIRDGDLETAPTPIEQELCSRTTAAFQLYSLGQYQQAQVIYEEMAAQFNDGLSKAMVIRCQQHMGAKT
jgi:adenylate cyclase